SAPPPASETRPADSGKEDAKKKKKDKKEREKEKEKAKQKQKEEKKREKRRRHSPELPPPPPPPPPVELTVIEPSAGVIVEADAQSNQEVAVVEEVNVQELEAAASSGPVAPEIVVTEEIADEDEDGAAAAAAEADKASTSGTSNLRIVDALSLSGAALNLLKRRRSFLKLSAPPRPPPPIVEIAKRASAAFLDLRLRSVLHRLQLLEKTSCESVLSNISETEDSYRGIRASGEVEISAKFSSGVLTVLVHRCRNLARIDGRQPSPYVKTYLLPDKTKRSKRRTNARRGTCNPSFGAQPLVYPDLTSGDLEMRTLQVSVWHSVALGANLFLGQALVPMEQCDQIFSGGKHWLPLRDRHTSPGGVSLPTLMYQGEIAVSIRFEADNKSEESDNNDEARGRLEIWVRSCRKLASATGGAATLNVSPYVKCYLLPSRHQASKRKSKVVKANPNPEFNAMLTYNGVTRRELRDRSIELTVWDHVLLGRNDFLGGVRLNIGDTARYSWMDARGHEQTLWTGMLSNPSKWIDASLILRPNMDPLATHIAQ
uniref:C2 domain-containing protein n=1 Tax=Macrostomum lignano TaxID=282301 RepID=A0A1I8G805_9PLAT